MRRICIILDYMTIEHQYFCSIWYGSALAMTSLYGDTTGYLYRHRIGEIYINVFVLILP